MAREIVLVLDSIRVRPYLAANSVISSCEQDVIAQKIFRFENL